MSQSRLGTVVVGGGTGFIGTSLCARLRKQGYDVFAVSRKPGPYRITWSELSERGLPDNTSAVVNVAGQNVLDPLRRWTAGFKQNVRASRINTTRSLAQAAATATHKPAVFVSMSGVGYYQPSDTATYTEESGGGDFDFLSRLCTEWESAAETDDPSIRTVVIRSGVVLGRHGGMIQQLFPPFYLGLGGRIGSGTQFFPWIHIDDIVGLIVFAIEQSSVNGVINGVAPDVVSNAGFTAAFAGALRRPAVLPLPAPVVQLIFGSDRAVMMLQGQRVIPERALQAGYHYQYPDITAACRQCSSLTYTAIKPY